MVFNKQEWKYKLDTKNQHDFGFGGKKKVIKFAQLKSTKKVGLLIRGRLYPVVKVVRTPTTDHLKSWKLQGDLKDVSVREQVNRLKALSGIVDDGRRDIEYVKIMEEYRFTNAPQIQRLLYFFNDYDGYDKTALKKRVKASGHNWNENLPINAFKPFRPVVKKEEIVNIKPVMPKPPPPKTKEQIKQNFEEDVIGNVNRKMEREERVYGKKKEPSKTFPDGEVYYKQDKPYADRAKNYDPEKYTSTLEGKQFLHKGKKMIKGRILREYAFQRGRIGWSLKGVLYPLFHHRDRFKKTNSWSFKEEDVSVNDETMLKDVMKARDTKSGFAMYFKYQVNKQKIPPQVVLEAFIHANNENSQKVQEKLRTDLKITPNDNVFFNVNPHTDTGKRVYDTIKDTRGDDGGLDRKLNIAKITIDRPLVDINFLPTPKDTTPKGWDWWKKSMRGGRPKMELLNEQLQTAVKDIRQHAHRELYKPVGQKQDIDNFDLSVEQPLIINPAVEGFTPLGTAPPPVPEQLADRLKQFGNLGSSSGEVPPVPPVPPNNEENILQDNNVNNIQMDIIEGMTKKLPQDRGYTKSTEEKGEDNIPEITDNGQQIQDAISLIAIKNGYDFTYYRTMIDNSSELKPKEPIKQYIDICLKEYGALFNIRSVPVYSYNVALDLETLKFINNLALQRDIEFKRAMIDLPSVIRELLDVEGENMTEGGEMGIVLNADDLNINMEDLKRAKEQKNTQKEAPPPPTTESDNVPSSTDRGNTEQIPLNKKPIQNEVIKRQKKVKPLKEHKGGIMFNIVDKVETRLRPNHRNLFRGSAGYEEKLVNPIPQGQLPMIRMRQVMEKKRNRLKFRIH